MRNIVLVNLENKPYKLITLKIVGEYIDYKKKPLQIKEFNYDGTIKEIKEIKFQDVYERFNFIENYMLEKSLEGYADINPGQGSSDINIDSFKIYEDQFFNYKIEFSKNNFGTTKYLQAFKTTPLIWLESNEEGELYENIKNIGENRKQKC